MKDNARFDSGTPGIGLEVATWLVEKHRSFMWVPIPGLTEVNTNPNPNLRGVGAHRTDRQERHLEP